MLCGHGTAGCHGRIEAHASSALKELGDYVLRCRADTIAYLYERLGPVATQEWLRRHLLIESEVV